MMNQTLYLQTDDEAAADQRDFIDEDDGKSEIKDLFTAQMTMGRLICEYKSGKDEAPAVMTDALPSIPSYHKHQSKKMKRK